MMRRVLVIVLWCCLPGSAGCEKSAPDPARAEVALASARLMPTESLQFETVYFEDQAKVKVVSGRAVSYEPLESFRAAKARSASAEGGEEVPAKARGPIGRSKAWLLEKLGVDAAAPGGRSQGARTGVRPAPPAEDSAEDDEAAADADESEPGEEEEADMEDEEAEEEEGEDEEDWDEDEDWGEDEEDAEEEDEGEDDEDEEPDEDEEDAEETGEDDEDEEP